MKFTPADTEKLLLSVAAMVARDRHSRGVLLNHPETVALLSTLGHRAGERGRDVAELMDRGSGAGPDDQVMQGVPEMLADVQVEATFPDGRKLVTSTTRSTEEPGSGPGPGAFRIGPGRIELNADRSADERLTLVFVNTGDRPVQIGSHIHLPDVNAALEFDRQAAHGFRLDIPSGTSQRFEPGASREVGGRRPPRQPPGARHPDQTDGGDLDG